MLSQLVFTCFKTYDKTHNMSIMSSFNCILNYELIVIQLLCFIEIKWVLLRVLHNTMCWLVIFSRVCMRRLLWACWVDVILMVVATATIVIVQLGNFSDGRWSIKWISFRLAWCQYNILSPHHNRGTITHYNSSPFAFVESSSRDSRLGTLMISFLCVENPIN